MRFLLNDRRGGECVRCRLCVGRVPLCGSSSSSIPPGSRDLPIAGGVTSSDGSGDVEGEESHTNCALLGKREVRWRLAGCVSIVFSYGE